VARRSAHSSPLLTAYLEGRNVVVQVRTSEPVWALLCARAEVIPMDPEARGYVELLREMDYGPWYIDGEYEPGGTNLGCDVRDCSRLTEFRFSVDRSEEIGWAPRPLDERAGAPLSDVADVSDGGVLVHADAGTDGWVPVYESRILSGPVYVRYRYHRGETCAGDGSLFEHWLDLDDLE
jgi:hypothetical protein